MAVRGCGMHNGGQTLCNGLHCLEVNIRRVNMVHARVCIHVREGCKGGTCALRLQKYLGTHCEMNRPPHFDTGLMSQHIPWKGDGGVYGSQIAMQSKVTFGEKGAGWRTLCIRRQRI
jgi:hypothetical protein